MAEIPLRQLTDRNDRPFHMRQHSIQSAILNLQSAIELSRPGALALIRLDFQTTVQLHSVQVAVLDAGLEP